MSTEESEAATTSSIMYSHLPEDILPGPPPSYEAAQRCINSLLKGLPSSDLQKSQSELRRGFYLDKHASKNQAKPKQSRKKKTYLTRQERRRMGLLRLPSTGWCYQYLTKLHALWLGYMRDTLGALKKCKTNEEALGLAVSRAEMIGAEIKVVRSKVRNQVGMSGIVVLETKMSFQIVTPDSKFKILLKQPSLFEFEVDRFKFQVFGKDLLTKPNERSVKKIKSSSIPDL